MADVLPEYGPTHGTTLGSVQAQEKLMDHDAGTQESVLPTQPRMPAWSWHQEATDSTRRPASASIRLDIPTTKPTSSHARAASVLPSFTFNASDTSGRHDSHTPPQTPEEAVASTPSRNGHRRGGSEFVGGDSRLGVSNAVSSSPTKTKPMSDSNAPATLPMPSRRGHAHRRSAAISSNDIVKLMQHASETQPRLSSSLPNSPLEYPEKAVVGGSSHAPISSVSDPFGPPLENSPVRLQTRPRVGFSDNIEFIPRPLSTISSETESSMSTVRGHSVNTSISSLLSLGTPSPQASRTPRVPPRTYSEEEIEAPPTTSPVKPRRVEKEGQWLKRGSSESLKRPVSEPAVHHKTSFIDPDPIVRPRKRSVTHALGFDRRRSEPSFNSTTNEPSRLSAISLQDAISVVRQEQYAQAAQESEQKSSVRRMKEWATAKISKKAKEASRALTATSSSSSLRPVSAGSIPSSLPERPEPAVAETDVDAVLSHPNLGGNANRSTPRSQALVDIHAAVSDQYRGSNLHSYDDSEAVLDLDAALGPFKTPAIGSHRHRKEMHSSRLTKDFVGAGAHYHRRAESAPNLPPFDHQQCADVSQTEMADVFEEEEEDTTNALEVRESSRTASVSDGGLDSVAENEAIDLPGAVHRSFDHAQQGLASNYASEADRPIPALSSSRPVLSNLVLEGRGTSIIEETIFEEGAPGTCEVEIVDADEEPRASSPTKSSDSSDTPTLLNPPSTTLILPDGNRSLAGSEAYQVSHFSSPSIRPGSLSSYNTGDQSQDMRLSVEVPSLVSSRSTMMSTVHDNGSRRDVAEVERAASITPHPAEPTIASDVRRKRGSIQSLSQLVGGSFTGRFGGSSNDLRPKTASDTAAKAAVKKENRLKKLIFWKTKRNSRQGLSSTP